MSLIGVNMLNTSTDSLCLAIALRSPGAVSGLTGMNEMSFAIAIAMHSESGFSIARLLLYQLFHHSYPWPRYLNIQLGLSACPWCLTLVSFPVLGGRVSGWTSQNLTTVD